MNIQDLLNPVLEGSDRSSHKPEGTTIPDRFSPACQTTQSYSMASSAIPASGKFVLLTDYKFPPPGTNSEAYCYQRPKPPIEPHEKQIDSFENHQTVENGPYEVLDKIDMRAFLPNHIFLEPPARPDSAVHKDYLRPREMPSQQVMRVWTDPPSLGDQRRAAWVRQYHVRELPWIAGSQIVQRSGGVIPGSGLVIVVRYLVMLGPEYSRTRTCEWEWRTEEELRNRLSPEQCHELIRDFRSNNDRLLETEAREQQKISALESSRIVAGQEIETKSTAKRDTTRVTEKPGVTIKQESEEDELPVVQRRQRPRITTAIADGTVIPRRPGNETNQARKRPRAEAGNIDIHEGPANVISRKSEGQGFAPAPKSQRPISKKHKTAHAETPPFANETSETCTSKATTESVESTGVIGAGDAAAMTSSRVSEQKSLDIHPRFTPINHPELAGQPQGSQHRSSQPADSRRLTSTPHPPSRTQSRSYFSAASNLSAKDYISNAAMASNARDESDDGLDLYASASQGTGSNTSIKTELDPLDLNFGDNLVGQSQDARDTDSDNSLERDPFRPVAGRQYHVSDEVPPRTAGPVRTSPPQSAAINKSPSLFYVPSPPEIVPSALTSLHSTPPLPTPHLHPTAPRGRQESPSLSAPAPARASSEKLQGSVYPPPVADEITVRRSARLGAKGQTNLPPALVNPLAKERMAKVRERPTRASRATPAAPKTKPTKTAPAPKATRKSRARKPQQSDVEEESSSANAEARAAEKEAIAAVGEILFQAAVAAVATPPEAEVPPQVTAAAAEAAAPEAEAQLQYDIAAAAVAAPEAGAEVPSAPEPKPIKKAPAPKATRKSRARKPQQTNSEVGSSSANAEALAADAQAIATAGESLFRLAAAAVQAARPEAEAQPQAAADAAVDAPPEGEPEEPKRKRGRPKGTFGPKRLAQERAVRLAQERAEADAAARSKAKGKGRATDL